MKRRGPKSEAEKKNSRDKLNGLRDRNNKIPKLSRDDCRYVAAETVRGVSISEIARELGISRPSVRRRQLRAIEYGMLEEHYLQGPNVSDAEKAKAVIAKRKKEFNKAYIGGTYKTPRPIELPDNKAFCVIALGDPHLDNKGTDLDMWEDWIEPLYRKEEWIRGVCLGDMTDNWLRFLGFLYEKAETTREEGYILTQKYIEDIGDRLDCIVGGNHDAWANEYWLQKLAEDLGVKYRPHGITLAYKTPNGRQIQVGMRHRFRGNSIYNPNHGVERATKLDGWRPNLLLGGDKHISGMGVVNDCETGKKTHCYQLAAFKVIDDYAEKINFRDDHVTPGMAFVIDPRFEDDQAKLITPFFCPHQAVDYTEYLRKKSKGRN